MALFDKLKTALQKKTTETTPTVSQNDYLDKQSRIKTLSEREYEAFLILLEGYTLRFCAEKMGVKYPTANTYQNAVYRKLGVNSKAKLIIGYKDLINNNK